MFTYPKKQKNESDNKLLIEYRNGNQNAFRELYIKYQPLIGNIVKKFSPDINFIKDASQEVWIMMIQKLDKFSGGSFHNWIYKVTENYCIDNFRKKKRSIILAENFTFNSIPYELSDYESKELRFIQAFKHFGSLSDLQRKVLYLRLKGYPFGKIAELIKKPYGTCLPAFTAGIVKLRRGLVRDGIITNKSIPLDLRKYNDKKQKRIRF